MEILESSAINKASESSVDLNESLSRPAKKKYAVSVRWELEQEERERQGCCICSGNCTEDLNALCCCFSRRVGGFFFLCEKDDGSPIVTAGPCWPFCTFVTAPLILGLSALVTYYVLFNDDSKLPTFVAYIYIAIVAFVTASLFGVSCQDPGLLERVTDEEAGESGWLWNEQVGSFRPNDALYCRECKAVIQEFDHLCPWTGTAIGKRNMPFFKTFVVSVNLLCYLSLGLVAYFMFRSA